MEFKDYYTVLGVERTADQKAISQAFRRLARQYHPDVNRGDAQAEARFKEINEAYQVLGDPDRRTKYDQVLEMRGRGGGWEEILRRAGGRSADGTTTVYGSAEGLGQFSEFFQQLFGGMGGGPFPGGLDDLLGQRAARGGGRRRSVQDVEGTVEITLEDAYRGTTRTVSVPAAGGRRGRNIEVTIPRGVQHGQRIRAAGQGYGGDLYLAVQIVPHPVFTRLDDDVQCEVAVPVWVAALGGALEVPTLNGPVTMTIPPDTQEGRTFRLRGQGMPHLRGEGAGDELVKVRLALPHPLTPRDRELLEEMRRLHDAKAAKS